MRKTHTDRSKTHIEKGTNTMKHARKLVSLLLALVLLLAMTTTAFAQDQVVTGDGQGTITITNAAKGETYTIYKLFDAAVTGTEGGSISYTGTIPDSLTTYFEKDANGYISAKEAAWQTNETTGAKEMSDGLRTALKTWAASADVLASVESDGTALSFKNVPYGYYVVTTTQGEQAITVCSTNPGAVIYDKNSSTPKDLTKTVADDNDNAPTDGVPSASIGDTITYTVKFTTANYNGAGTGAKEIVSYTIADDLPDFLSNVTVESIIVDNDGNDTTTTDQADVTAQFVDKQIVIDWYDETNNKFLYDNGATVTITYTATLTEKVAIDGAGNTNTVTLTWITKGNTTPNPDDKLEDEATIYSYAIALKKVNDKGVALAGAVFEFPFYVKTTPDTDGAYLYAGKTAAEGLTNQITSPADGVIVIKGVASGTYSVSEVTAPSGYNKLLSDVEITAVKTGETTTNKTFYIDENGNITETATTTTVNVTLNNIAAAAIVVVNKTGAQLPSTGGMGTTLFYVLGSVLAVGAIALLITRRRMSAR